MGRKRKGSDAISVGAGRRFSRDQANPDGAIIASIKPERRGSTQPLFYFSEVVQELQEEDPTYGFQHMVEKVPPLQPPVQDPESGKDASIADSLPNRGAGRKWAYKNVFGISISFVCIFSSFISLQNLQSTINSSGGLGLASLSLLYAFFTLAGFVAPSVLKILGTKYALLLSFICHLCYTLANFYPSWYTLVPVSILLGAASALVWSAGSSHLVQVAVTVAPRLGVDKDHLISTYTGIFFAFFQASQIPGNLASSLILFPYGDTTNSTFLGNDSELTSNGSDSEGVCKQAETGHDFDRKLLYILVSLYAVFVISGIGVLITLVSNFGTEKRTANQSRLKVLFRDPLVELLGIMKNYKMLLIAPISVFGGLEQSFAFGTFPEAFIAQCFGTYQVGFTLIALGLSSGFTSALYGKLTKYIPRLVIFFFGGLLNIGLLVFLVVWVPVPSYVFIFSFAVLWGAADGVWNTMTTSLTGILFPDCSGSAYSAQRIYLALGFTVGFVMAEVLTVEERVWFMLVGVLMSLAAVLAIELSTHKYCSRRIKGEPDSTESCDTNDMGDIDEIKDSSESVSSKELEAKGGGSKELEANGSNGGKENSAGSGTVVSIDVVEIAAL